MPKLTSAETRHARKLCKERDGDKCSLNLKDGSPCNRPGKEYRKEKRRDLDLHHKDDNPENNPQDGSNWALACHSCNCRQTPRGKRKHPYFAGFKNLKELYESKSKGKRSWQDEREWQYAQRNIKPATMRKNEEAEPLFRGAVNELITKLGEMKRKDLLDAASERANCSQSTGARYLDKLISLFGEYDCNPDKDNEMVVTRRKEA